MGMWWQCQYPDPPAHSQPHGGDAGEDLDLPLVVPPGLWWSSELGRGKSDIISVSNASCFFFFFSSASSPSSLLIANRYHESASEAAAADKAVLPGQRLELSEAVLPESPAAAADGNKTANVGD